MKRASPRVPGQRLARDLDLPNKRLNIVLDWPATMDDSGVTAAIPAQAITERDMDIERYRKSRIERGKPRAMIGFGYLGSELRSSRIARISWSRAAVFRNQCDGAILR
jgi:hypothetical protein